MWWMWIVIAAWGITFVADWLVILGWDPREWKGGRRRVRGKHERKD